MDETTHTQRSALFREAVIFQLKLVADGFRDLVLVPVSLIAALVGLLRGGDEADREFRQVIELGRRSEQWINLFGNHPPEAGDGQAASLDTLLDRAEEVVREQARKGGVSETAARALERAIHTTQQSARRNRDATPQKGDRDP